MKLLEPIEVLKQCGWKVREMQLTDSFFIYLAFAPDNMLN